MVGFYHPLQQTPPRLTYALTCGGLPPGTDASMAPRVPLPARYVTSTDKLSMSTQESSPVYTYRDSKGARVCTTSPEWESRDPTQGDRAKACP